MFSAHWAHTDHPQWVTRRIYLHRGNYTWSDCLTASTGVNRRYEHESELGEWAGTGSGTALLTGDYQFGDYGDGSYHWGSAVDRIG